MSVFASDYVVLDVETNGLSSLRDDLLSISIYQPDTQKLYKKNLDDFIKEFYAKYGNDPRFTFEAGDAAALDSCFKRFGKPDLLVTDIGCY